MRDWKSICSKLLSPPFRLVLILTVFCTATLVAVFVEGWETAPIAYAVYVVSFYTLSVVCIICSKTIPGYYKNIKGKVYENKYANQYFTDVAFKTHVNLYCSLIFNFIYVAVNVISGFIYSTYWFGIFAVYYAIMAIMRFLLIDM